MDQNSPLQATAEACCTLDITGSEQERLVSMFNGLGNPIRFEIMKYLVTHKICITGDIVDSLPLAQATISQHLKVLENSGWIKRFAKGASTEICLDNSNINWFSEQVGDIF